MDKKTEGIVFLEIGNTGKDGILYVVVLSLQKMTWLRMFFQNIKQLFTADFTKNGHKSIFCAINLS